MLTDNPEELQVVSRSAGVSEGAGLDQGYRWIAARSDHSTARMPKLVKMYLLHVRNLKLESVVEPVTLMELIDGFRQGLAPNNIEIAGSNICDLRATF